MRSNTVVVEVVEGRRQASRAPATLLALALLALSIAKSVCRQPR